MVLQEVIRGAARPQDLASSRSRVELQAINSGTLEGTIAIMDCDDKNIVSKIEK